MKRFIRCSNICGILVDDTVLTEFARIQFEEILEESYYDHIRMDSYKLAEEAVQRLIDVEKGQYDGDTIVDTTRLTPDAVEYITQLYVELADKIIPWDEQPW